MSNLCIIIDGVNLRRDATISADLLLTTTAPRNYATVFGKSGPADGNPNQWLEIRGDDGTEAWVRADVVKWLVGDFRLLGAGAYDALVPGVTAFPPAGATAGQTPASASSSPATPSTGLLPCPCPGSNENSYGNVYAGVTHDGWDIAGPVGTPIVASADGLVMAVLKSTHGSKSVLDEGIALNTPAVLSDPNWGYGYGNAVLVRYDRATLPVSAQVAIASPFVYILTAHMNDVSVAVGEMVTAKTILGHRGKSGNANGAHVHLSVSVSNKSNLTSVYGVTRVDPALVFAL